MAAVAPEIKATAPPPLLNYPIVQFTPSSFLGTPTLSVKKAIQKPKKLRRVSDAVKNTQKSRKLRKVSGEEDTRKSRQRREITDYIKIEALYNPDAITAYHHYDSKKHPDVDSKDLINNAKKHLSSIGWSFYYIQKGEDRKEIRYEFPSGRVYISLKAACKAFISGLAIATGPIHDRYESVPKSRINDEVQGVSAVHILARYAHDEVQGFSAAQFLARYAHFRFFHTFAFIIWLMNS